MPMNINGNSERLSATADRIKNLRVDKLPQKEKTDSTPGEDKAVELLISKEGIKSYKDSIIKKELEALGNTGVILTDYKMVIGSRLPSTYGEKNENGEYECIYQSIEDKADSLLKVYAEIYDEIQKGHEAGTREIYVEDKTSETGYRKLTKEEEIAKLDEAYQVYVNQFERNNDRDIIEKLAAYVKKVSRLSSGRAGLAGKAGDELEKRKAELDKLPENFGKNLIAASKLFTEQYNLQKPGTVNITDLLKGISIFQKR